MLPHYLILYSHPAHSLHLSHLALLLIPQVLQMQLLLVTQSLPQKLIAIQQPFSTSVQLAQPPSLDPYHQGADARIRVTVLSYQGLFYEGASGEAVPLLAQSYTQSADGLTYTFKLRQGVKFHTGQTMTAADVKYSYDYLRDSKNGSPGAGDLSTVASISAPDDDTVIFTLSSRNGLLPMTLTHRYGGVIPKDYFATPDAKAKLNQVSVGTGPFKLKQFRQNSVLVFEKFKDYWQKGLPHLDEVTFAFMPNSAAMAVAATNGRIDMAIFTRPQDTEQLTKVKGL